MARKSMIGPITFLVVAFGIPWAGWLFINDERLNLWLFPGFASVAGFVASFAEGGKNGLTVFSRRVFTIRSALTHVVVAALIPLLLGLSYLLGTGISLSSIALFPSAVLGLSLGAALLTGPMAEEFGWRGYLQPLLLERLAPFWVALVVGFVWWSWHIALYRNSVFASPISALNFLAYLETWSVFMVFLVYRAHGSVWPAVTLHWAANTHPGILQALLPSVDGSKLPGGSKGSLYYFGVACVFALINRGFFFAKQASSGVLDGTANNSFKSKPLRGSALFRR